MGIENQYIAKAITGGNAESLRSIDIRWFQTEEATIESIRKHSRDYDKLPDLATLKADLGFEPESTPEPLQYYIDKLRDKAIRFALSGGWAESETHLGNDDIDLARVRMFEAVQEANRVSDGGKKIFSPFDIDVIEEHKTDYAATKRAVGPDGIITPWEALNNLSWGIHCGELWTIAARLKTGKSYALLMMAYEAYLEEHNSLIISLEMSKKACSRRVYSMVTGVRVDDIRKGRVGSFHEKDYFDELIDTDNEGFWILDSTDIHTVPDIEARITEQLKGVPQTEPKLAVFLDGMYFLSDYRNAQSRTEQMSNVVGDLALMSKRWGVPVIQTVQLNRQVNIEKLRAGAENIGLTDRIPQDSHLVMLMLQPEEYKAERKMLFRVTSNREGPPGDFTTNWDFDEVDFDEIENENFEPQSLASTPIAGSLT